jgi:hypothetical protein
MKKILFILISAFLLSSVYSQNINGRFSSSVYTFERFDTANTSETNVRTFQSLLLNVNKDNFSFRTRVNLEANIGNALDKDPRFRFYNLYLEFRKIFDIATVRLGRQSLFYRVGGGVYDGANLVLDYSGFQLSGFYGGNVPTYQKMELTDDWSKDYILGARLQITALENFRFAANYVDKNFKPFEYNTIRLDENLNPINVLVQSKSNQYRFVSGEASYRMPKIFNVYTRYDFDLNFEKTSKFEIGGRYDQIDRFGISLYYNFREPLIRYNSIFSVFNYGNTQEIEGGLDYRISETVTVTGKFANVTYRDDDAQRFTIGMKSEYGSLSYRKTFGYAGELDAISVYTARSFMDGLITPSVGLTLANYKLSPDSDKNNITTLLGGLNYRPLRVLSFDLQVQYLNNKIYSNDTRVFFKLNHWFNSNLDLF